MTVQNLYTQYLEGKVTQSKFLYEVRRDQNLTMISHQNSFDDVVRILKSKSIISEKAYKESTGKQDVEIIAKTIDMVNPYEYSRGLNYELDIMDVPATSGDLSEDNVLKAQKKVLANLTKNPQFYFDKINGKGEVSEKWIEVTKKEMDAIGKGKKAKSIMREGYEIPKNERDFKKVYNALKEPDYMESILPTLMSFKSKDVANLARGIAQEFDVEYGIAITALEKIGNEELKNSNLNEHGQYADRVADVNADSSPLNEKTESLYEKYAEKMGKTVEEVKEMIAQKKKSEVVEEVAESLDELYSPNEELEAKFYGDGSISLIVHGKGGNMSGQPPYFSTAAISPDEFTYTWIKQQLSKVGHDVDNNEIDQFLGKVKEKINIPKNDELNEDIEIGHTDNEPHFVKAELYLIAKQASELYKIVDSLSDMGEIDFPSWWQSKITLSKNYLQGAKDYLEGALATGGEEQEVDEALTAKTNDPIHNSNVQSKINSVPNSAAKSELTKAFQSGKSIDV